MLSSLLIALIILSSSTILSLPAYHHNTEVYKLESLQSELLFTQSEAMSQYQKKYSDPFSYNLMGHVDKSRRLVDGNKSLVVYLGMGRSEIKTSHHNY